MHTFPTAAVDVAMSRTKSSPWFGAATEMGFVPSAGYDENKSVKDRISQHTTEME